MIFFIILAPGLWRNEQVLVLNIDTLVTRMQLPCILTRLYYVRIMSNRSEGPSPYDDVTHIVDICIAIGTMFSRQQVPVKY